METADVDSTELDPETLARFGRDLRLRRAEIERHGVGPAPVLTHLDRAIESVEEEAFGRCTQCEGTVETSRLEADFTTRVCLAHYSPEEIRQLEQDLEWTARVQRDLQPAGVPVIAGWELAAHARPARIVAGDHHDFFPLGAGAQAAAVADVMGKGLSAALLAASLQAALRSLGPQHDDPGALAGRVNELFRFNLNLISFVSLVLVAVEPEGGALRWCNAGHEPPFHWDAASGEVTELASSGPAIGLDPGARYESSAMRLGRGDLVLLYTDGLVEADSPDGGRFGAARVASALSRCAGYGAQAFLASLRAELDAFTGGAVTDDLTLVALRRR